MDNATFHQRTDIQKAITDAGHTHEYLPPYSPERNPIEQKWAHAKAIRRSNGQRVNAIFRTGNWNQN